ncbi:hypothetical protein LPJ66_004025 [Kickxella alabastrina]|uniref:Uncharacterized protein n=1 Tax=Kickxella alabastrina TaxID=61397 RepID=A0ACC1IKS7_9FUNG|nr:hypothetical protein LPJ66_004025 [Kickxella alabastrina]
MLASAALVSGSIISGYAPGWKDLNSVDVSKFTHINLAYAEPQANGSFTFEASYNIGEFSDKVHKAGSRAILAVGGYLGSIHVSDVLKNSDKRNRMISTIVGYIRDSRLDGVDIDWVGSECNKADLQNDASNLLILVRELRQALNYSFGPDSKKIIALGVGMSPFAGPNGPLSDVSEYAKWVDYINILSYDVNGPHSSTTGPNSPLNYEYGRGAQYSLISAIDSWTAAKFPVNQIIAGISFYGRSSKSTVDMLTQPWNVYQPQESEIPRGDEDDGLWVDRCTNKPASYSGIWSYKNLRKQGVLQSLELATTPWQRNWDSLSLTPWVFNPSSKVFISYDDPTSIAAKVNYALGKGLGGVTIYDITMDYNNELISAITNIIQPEPPRNNADVNQSWAQLPSITPTRPLTVPNESIDWPSSSISIVLVV